MKAIQPQTQPKHTKCSCRSEREEEEVVLFTLFFNPSYLELRCSDSRTVSGYAKLLPSPLLSSNICRY
ncbi:uncharacterized protein DS421_14g469340 [Arachis hypogaea]|nr:uncharacterized protein DS421_14g469340 [Arachis hypogaea]